MEDYVDVIHQLADRYHMEAPALIAHSFGARIAIRYAGRHPAVSYTHLDVYKRQAVISASEAL